MKIIAKFMDCRRMVVVATFASAMVMFSQFSFAQNRWTFEFRPGVNFATQKLGNTELKTGFGFEGSIAYRFMPHLSVYAGWSWNKFGSDQVLGNSELEYEETGYTYGLQFIHPIGESNVNFLVRAGALSNHIEVEHGREIIADTGHGFGWQVEGGIVLPLAEKWRLLPSVRYRSLSREIEFGSVKESVNLNYLSIGIGIATVF